MTPPSALVTVLVLLDSRIMEASPGPGLCWLIGKMPQEGSGCYGVKRMFAIALRLAQTQVGIAQDAWPRAERTCPLFAFVFLLQNGRKPVRIT